MLWIAEGLSSGYGGKGRRPLVVTSRETSISLPPRGVPGWGELRMARPGVKIWPLAITKLRDGGVVCEETTGRLARAVKRRVLTVGEGMVGGLAGSAGWWVDGALGKGEKGGVALCDEDWGRRGEIWLFSSRGMDKTEWVCRGIITGARLVRVGLWAWNAGVWEPEIDLAGDWSHSMGLGV